MEDMLPSDDDGSRTEWPAPIPRYLTEHGKAVRRAWVRSEKGRAYYRKYAQTESGKKAIAKKNRKQIDNGNRRKYYQTPKGRACQKRQYNKKMADPGRKLMERIGVRLANAIRNPNKDSGRLAKYTEFGNCADIVAHFESTFEPWMTWDNYGPYRLNKPRTWDIGHRIPLSKYDANDEEDFRRCWTKANLFAQCSKENNDNRDAMPPDEVLQPLKAIWPAAWCV